MAIKPVNVSLSFRICVYPSVYEKGVYTAHCLELDVIGEGTTAQGAIGQLLEAIETQVSIHRDEATELFFPAPNFVWQKYNQAKRAGRKIADKLMEQIFARANKRLGYSASSGLNNRVENIVATKQVMDECLLANA